MAAGPKLPLFSPEHLSMALWSLATLQHQPAQPFLVQLLSAALPQLSSFKPSHFSHTVWALSKLDVIPSPLWLSTFWSNSGPTLTRFAAKELVTTASAVAKLQLQPPAAWLQGLAAAVHQNMGQFDSGSLLEVLQAVQKLQARQPGSSIGSSVGQAGSSRSGRYTRNSSIVPFDRQELQQLQQAVRFVSIRSSSFRSSSSSRRNSSSLARQGSSSSSDGGSSGSELLSVTSTAWQRPRQLQLEEGVEDCSSVEAMFGISSSTAGSRLYSQQRQQDLSAAAVLQQLDASAAEAYSMACLVVLMPDWLQRKVAHWPRQLAAEREASQQQQQQWHMNRLQLERNLQASSVG